MGAIALSADDRWLATGDEFGGDVVIWDAARCEAVRQLEGHETAITDLDWSGDGAVLASASEDDRAVVWDARTGQQIQSLVLDGAVWTVDLTRDGQRLVAASHGGNAVVWDRASPDDLTLLPHQGPVREAWWNTAEDRVVTASDDRTVAVWDLVSGERLMQWDAHPKGVRSVRWGPREGSVTTTGNDGTAAVWDATTGALVHRFEGHQPYLSVQDRSSDGRWMVTGGRDPVARVWDVERGQLTASLGGHEPWLEHIAISPDATRVLTTNGSGGRVALWRLPDGQLLEEIPVGRASEVAWSASGDRWWFGGADDVDGVVGCTGTSTREVRSQIPWVGPSAWTGSTIVATSSFGSVAAWNGADGTHTSLPSHMVTPTVLTVSASGDVVGTGGRFGEINTIRRSTADKTDGLAIEGVAALAVSPDGTLWLGATGRELYLFRSGESRLLIDGGFGPRTAVAWSPDSAQWASGGSGGRVVVGRVDQEKARWSIWEPLGSTTTALIFSPDSQQLAAAGDDGSVGLHHLRSGELALELQASGPVREALAFDPAGDWLAGAGEDGTVVVWDVKTGRLATRWTAHDSMVASVAWSPDGTRLLTTGRDGPARLWSAGGSLLATVAMARDGGWLVVTPDGHGEAAGVDALEHVEDVAPEPGLFRRMFAPTWSAAP